jgi:hypothetical protein
VRAEGIEPSRGYPQRIFVPSTTFAASPNAFALQRVCGLDYTFTLARARLRCCPSSLYTFASVAQPNTLGSGLPVTGSPEFEQFCSPSFPRGTQFCLSPLRLPFRHARTNRNLAINGSLAKRKLKLDFGGVLAVFSRHLCGLCRDILSWQAWRLEGHTLMTQASTMFLMWEGGIVCDVPFPRISHVRYLCDMFVEVQIGRLAGYDPRAQFWVARPQVQRMRASSTCHWCVSRRGCVSRERIAATSRA